VVFHVILDRVFPPEQSDDEVGAAFQAGHVRWWVTGPQHTHRVGVAPCVWPVMSVMDDEGEVA